MLNKYRKQIDKIDTKFVKLFEKRMDVAKKVGEYKKQRNMEIFVAEREKTILEKRAAQVKNPEYKKYAADFFENVMRISRSLQSKIVCKEIHSEIVTADFNDENLKVAYPGIAGSYSGEALKTFFPNAKNVINTVTFNEVAELVSKGDVDYGVLPFENNSSGAIADTLDLIISHKLRIAGELNIDIAHCLLGTQDCEISNIEEIYSHNQGFLQSKAYLDTLGDVKCIPLDNTALAAKFVAESKNKTKAAIASRLAGETYGLKVLKENINENSSNSTRFVIVSNKLTGGADCDKISAIFTTRHKSGALCDVLAVFAQNSINISHIESRPLKERNFEYVFHIDFEGNLADENVTSTISQVQSLGAEFTVLGNYKSQINK